jgi:hypothetical protein
VLARVGFALVTNVAPIEPVLQHQIECPAGKPFTAGQPSAAGSSSVGAPSGDSRCALRPISYPMFNGEPGAGFS